MKAKGKVLTLFFMDENTDGRIKCTIGGTKCLAYKISREDIGLCKNLDKLKQSGIYFLFGTPNETNAKEVVYIGQANVRKNGEGLLNRLTEHKRKSDKDYWNYAIAFTTTDDSLGSTEINYLENYFCNLAKEANRYSVKNGNEPTIGNISEEQICSLSSFMSDTELILTALNYKVFIPIKQTKKSLNKTENDIFYIERKNRKTGITVKATGQKTKDGFVVFKGSYVAEKDMKVLYPTVKEIRQKAKVGKDRLLQDDILFSSPSYAAAFVVGGTTNGLVDWKTKDGICLKNLLND